MGDTELAGQSGPPEVLVPGFVVLANEGHFLVRQLRVGVLAPLVIPVALPHVPHVVLLRTTNEVVRVHAGGVVARMADHNPLQGFNRNSYLLGVGDTVGILVLSVDTLYSVSERCLSSRPFNAGSVHRETFRLAKKGP